MRAKLSDWTLAHDETAPAWIAPVYVRDWQRAAVDEARAILAETEPIRRGTLTAHVPLGGLDDGADCGAPSALVDALRAFVADATDGYMTYHCLTCGVSAGPMDGLDACAERARGHEMRARTWTE